MQQSVLLIEGSFLQEFDIAWLVSKEECVGLIQSLTLCGLWQRKNAFSKDEPCAVTDIVWVGGRGRMRFSNIKLVQSMTLCGSVAEEVCSL